MDGINADKAIGGKDANARNLTEKMILHFDYLPCVNYAALSSGIETCSTFIIGNHDDKDWHNITVTIRGEKIADSISHIDSIRQGQSFQLNTIKITPDINSLLASTETVKTTFSLKIEQGDETLWEREYPISLLAYDQWMGSAIMPELISAFVVPNQPLLSRVLVKAGKFLEELTGSSALDEYQTLDRNRVRSQVAAVYEALRSEGIVYCTPPASFEEFGQRIRLSDQVLEEKLGTCIDTSLLMASCLEKVGINPILVVFNGHTLVGAWLTPSVYPQMIGDDASLLTKETADGNNNLVLVESTSITSSTPVTFEEAVKSADQKIRDEQSFLYFVDVHRCRLGHIHPLPQRIEENGTWKAAEGIEHENATMEVSSLSHYDLRLEDNGKELTKQQIWERKLLDFSLRNNLLNTRVGKRAVPFISFGIDKLEDHLQNGEDYQITPCPGTKIQPGLHGVYDSLHQASQHQALVSEFIKSNKIVSYLTDTELQSTLKYVYRTARTSLEENGANSLFLSLGMLKWYETQKSEQPRFAPILLLPVDIIRKSGNNFVIRKRDEDTFLNITLVEFLKQNFNINLSQLQNTLPKDEAGVDVKYVLTYIRRAIMEHKKWDVLEESVLGLFSFNKFVMWNDIHSHADILRHNPMIASLMERRNMLKDDDERVDARVIDMENAPMDFAIPLDVDSSQFEAVVESGRGKSFILQGPPGTGKSQTITNMIANALFQGKRVLFVAEKMAALSVVQSRLERIGLGAFCLELHSNKVTKKHFLEQMEKVLKTTKIQQPEAFQAESDELFAERKELINYMQAIHSPTDSGISLYDCLSEYLKLDCEEIDASQLPDEMLSVGKTKSYQEHAVRLQAILQLVGKIKGNALSGLEPLDNRQASLDDIKASLQKINDIYGQYENLRDEHNRQYPFPVADEQDLLWLSDFTKEITAIDTLNTRLLDCSDDAKVTEDLKHVISLHKEQEEAKDYIGSICSEDICRENVDELKALWDDIQMKWLLPRYFAKKGFLRRMQQYGHVRADDVYPLLQQVKRYQDCSQELSDSPTDIAGFFDTATMNAADRWDVMGKTVDRLPVLSRLIEDYGHRKNSKSSLLKDALAQSFQAGWASFKTAYLDSSKTLSDHHRQMTALCRHLSSLVSDCPDTMTAATKSGEWLQAFGGIKDWYLWIEEKRQLTASGLSAIAEQMEQGLQPQEALDAFMKGIWHRIIVKTVDSNPQLRTFNGLLFNQQIEKYKRDTRRFQELSKEVLYSRLASHVPSALTASSDGSEVSILKRNINNGGRGTSIRGIIDSIPTLLPRLCPCMLMSPLSVAQFLDLGTEKFDLVIFDEASQMPTSEAVGAIARGRALIVVGDSKQMPPTSFFTSTQVDEEEADIDDMESILDDCNTLSMKEYQLNWHYRSKHESLIAFSNIQYYDNHLLTFPSVDDKDVKVRMIKIDGVYDKGKTRSNPDEAKAIVAEVVRRLKDPELSKRSIGIISFSKVQQNLIEDMLYEVLDQNAELKETAVNSEEPLFVKNLENVQGDERDIILFSVGYGPDKYGKVSMNFGPLNNTGGERRLNVAVSRARYEMLVFSTLSSGQIDLRRSNAKGVAGLKYFLEFAENGLLPDQQQDGGGSSNDHVMTEQIADAIRQEGFLATTNIGRSHFKIDIAVSTKEAPNKYILCIMCDGKNYYETKTTRDREIVQPSVLQMLRWNTMRVYSIDWYENRSRVVQQILDEIRAIGQNGQKQQTVEPAPVRAFSVESLKPEDDAPVSKNAHQQSYHEAPPPVLKQSPLKMTNKAIQAIVLDIIRAEQPVCHNYLCKRLGRILSHVHSGPHLQALVTSAAKDCCRVKADVGDDYYFADKETAAHYDSYRGKSPRTIAEIPQIEIANAVMEAVAEEFSLPANSIAPLVARKLGFGNTGATIKETINSVIAILKREHRLAEKNGLLSIPNNSI